MKIKALQSLLRTAICDILQQPVNGSTVRVSYPTNGAPGFAITDTVLFLYLHEADDSYGNDRSPVYHTENGTVYRDHVGTRVWDILLTCYGTDGHEWLDQVRAGVLWEKTRRTLESKNVCLVPTNPAIVRSPELFNGQWWERSDMTLRYNELYVDTENVGAIEHVILTVPHDSVPSSGNQDDFTGSVNAP